MASRKDSIPQIETLSVALNAKAQRLKQTEYRPAHLFLISVTLYWSLALLPSFATYFYTFRWHTAVGTGVVGALWFWKGRKRSHGQMTAVTLLLLCVAVLSCLGSSLQTYSLLRTGALALLFSFGVAGCGALFSTPAGLRAGFMSLSVYYAIAVFTVAYAGATTDVYVTDVHYRFQGNDELKATGVGSVIVAAIPFLLWAVKYYRRNYSLILYALSAWLILLLVATKAKGSIGAAMVIVPVSYFALRSRKLSRSVAASLAVVALAGVLLTTSPELRQLARIEDAGHQFDMDTVTTGRSERWETLVIGAMERPLVGHGLGMSRYHHLDADSLNWSLATQRSNQQVAHNEHLGVLYETGLFGLFCFWWLLGIVCRSGHGVLTMQPSYWRDVVAVSFISWLANLLDTLSHDPFLTVGNPAAFLFWIKAALTVSGYYLLVSQQAQVALRQVNNRNNLRTMSGPMSQLPIKINPSLSSCTTH